MGQAQNKAKELRKQRGKAGKANQPEPQTVLSDLGIVDYLQLAEAAKGNSLSPGPRSALRRAQDKQAGTPSA